MVFSEARALAVLFSRASRMALLRGTGDGVTMPGTGDIVTVLGRGDGVTVGTGDGVELRTGDGEMVKFLGTGDSAVSSLGLAVPALE